LVLAVSATSASAFAGRSGGFKYSAAFARDLIFSTTARLDPEWPTSM